MSILRNPVKNKFAMIEVHIIENMNISHPAFRVACYLISRPDNWQINNADIQKRFNIRDTKTLTGYWKELMKAGVVFRKAKPKSAGRFQGFDYAIGECPEGWEIDNFTVGGSTTNGSAVNGSTHQHNKTDINNKDSNNKKPELPQEHSDECVTSLHDEAALTSKNQSAKKRKPERLRAAQVPKSSHPFTHNALSILGDTLKAHSDKGGSHSFAMSKRDGKLTISKDHLPVIEANLRDLANHLGLDHSGVANALLSIYNARFRDREACNLALLAGVNMGMHREKAGADAVDYVQWACGVEV